MERLSLIEAYDDGRWASTFYRLWREYGDAQPHFERQYEELVDQYFRLEDDYYYRAFLEGIADEQEEHEEGSLA